MIPLMLLFTYLLIGLVCSSIYTLQRIMREGFYPDPESYRNYQDLQLLIILIWPVVAPLFLLFEVLSRVMNVVGKLLERILKKG